jgi:hypothetical protein
MLPQLATGLVLFFSSFDTQSFRVSNSPVEEAVLNKFPKLKGKRLCQTGGPLYTLETPCINGVVACSKVLLQKLLQGGMLGFVGFPELYILLPSAKWGFGPT